MTMAAVGAVIGAVTEARAQVEVPPSFDGWIRVEDNFVREGDFISVWSSEFGVRYGLLQFDVSQFAGQTLADVSLDLYMPDSGTGSSPDEPIKMHASVIDPASGTFGFRVDLNSGDGPTCEKDLSLTITGGAPLSASGDSWVREADPGATFENDLVSVWSAASGDGGGANRRAGLVEFDVSSLAGQTLAGARLSLFANRGCCPLKQIASEFPTAGPVGTLSWNDVNPDSRGLAPFEQLRSYDLAPGAGVDTYVDSLHATPADLPRIGAAAGDGILSILLKVVEDGADYEQDWGDDGTRNRPLRLIVDIAPPLGIPTLSTWGLMAMALLLVLATAAYRKRRILQPAATNGSKAH